MFNVLFIRDLASRFSRANIPITAVSVNPGYCVSSLRRNMPLILRLLDRLTEMLIARTTEEGSRQLIWASVSGKDRSDLNGSFVMDSTVYEPSDFAISEKGKEAQERIWVCDPSYNVSHTS